MSRLKLLTLVGTRPELIKLSRTIQEADRAFEQLLVHTGQNYDYELNELFFQDLEIRKPDRFLAAAGGSAAKTIARVIERLDEVLEEVRPDAMLLLGDTNSCLGVIAAKRRKIPIFHIEAGNRCFDQRVPEEINRRVVDHLSDVNITYTEHARRYLLDEGLPPDRVVKVGSPMREVFQTFAPQIDASDALQQFGVEPERYFVVSAHREENVDEPRRLTMLIEALNAVCADTGFAALFSVHPRTRARLDGLSSPLLGPPIRCMKPLGFFDYAKLQKHAAAVISDSGTLTEESALLGFPAIMVREAHERPEGMDQAIALRSGVKPEQLVEMVRLAISHKGRRFRAPPDYAADDVSIKVVRIIASFTGLVNRTVWSISEL